MCNLSKEGKREIKPRSRLNHREKINGLPEVWWVEDRDEIGEGD